MLFVTEKPTSHDLPEVSSQNVKSSEQYVLEIEEDSTISQDNGELEIEYGIKIEADEDEGVIPHDIISPLEAIDGESAHFSAALADISDYSKFYDAPTTSHQEQFDHQSQVKNKLD